MRGPSLASELLFLLQLTCQDAGWWKQTATQPAAQGGRGETAANEQQLTQALGRSPVPRCTRPLPSASSRANVM